ncbi:MAG: phytanoyl-CoA dioxygenase family protein [Planctomycetota bacterium]|nr:phytanoyl-CoA dioxygenase family protein [Planctomycetota bacterium]MDA1137054.1 phytanoyl-CoA dioxygenase family protein [Planctomycetota bacterium]
MLTLEHTLSFEKDGFVLIDDYFSQEETALLLADLENNSRIQDNKFDMPDADGRSSKLSLWGGISDDIFGVVSRLPRMVNGARALLREDVYHWHSKLMFKEPKIGGAWEWHQDYGYWYNDNCPFPRLVSGMLALDDATLANGCLQVLVGSHLAGRLEHGRSGNQSGANPDRVNALKERLAVRPVAAKAGSMLFFHCNLLHSSGPNNSDLPRRAYICCYNAMSNAPFGGKGHGKPTPIDMSTDADLKGSE